MWEVKMMKILLISGHGAGDSGALGNGYQEATETRKVVSQVANYLYSAGVDVTVYNQNKNAFYEYQKGTLNFGGTFDYVLEIHFNASNGQGKGTEIYVTTAEKHSTVEQKIVNNLGTYFVNRGVKATNWSVIYYAKRLGMSSALLEVCFIDNKSDMATYAKNFQSVCKAIANGVLEGFGLTTAKPIPTPPENKPDTGSYTYKVAVMEGMKVRSNADTGAYCDTGVVLPHGYKIIFDRILQGNLYTWGSYIGADSGKRRYVAIKNKKTGTQYLKQV